MGMGLCPTRASRAREPRYYYEDVIIIIEQYKLHLNDEKTEFLVIGTRQ